MWGSERERAVIFNKKIQTHIDEECNVVVLDKGGKIMCYVSIIKKVMRQKHNLFPNHHQVVNVRDIKYACSHFGKNPHKNVNWNASIEKLYDRHLLFLTIVEGLSPLWSLMQKSMNVILVVSLVRYISFTCSNAKVDKVEAFSLTPGGVKPSLRRTIQTWQKYVPCWSLL